MGQPLTARAVRCPNCGAPLYFEAETGMLRCEHCGAALDPETVDGRTALDGAAKKGGADGLSAFECSSCGAQMVTSGVTAALHCPWCGSNTVVPAQFSGDLRPDWIIPFQTTRAQALEAYRAYYRGSIFKRFMQPRAFRRCNEVEDLQGVYVPFRLYSGAAEVEAVYDTYDVERRSLFYETRAVYREKIRAVLRFEKVPADASHRMDDDLMDSIEPYDLTALKPFSLSYLPGLLAERWDVRAREDEKRAAERVKKTAAARAAREIRHETLAETRQAQIKLRTEQAQYALLPVWLLTARWKGGKRTFAMNGQTGRFTGELPMSVPKTLTLMALAYALPVVLLVLIRGSLWALGATLGLFTAFAAWASLFWTMQVGPVHSAWDAAAYSSEKIDVRRRAEHWLKRERTWRLHPFLSARKPDKKLHL